MAAQRPAGSSTVSLANSQPRRSLDPISSVPPDYATYTSSGEGLISEARLRPDGRLSVLLNLKRVLPDLPRNYAKPVGEFAVDPSLATDTDGAALSKAVSSDEILSPPLSIVIMITGSRGDVQPFLALGKQLLRHGHRVRIATHGTFRRFVTDSNLEFFDTGGDPQELMSYMVRNPGLMPGWASLTNGDIGRKRKTMAEILEGCWRACWQPDGEQGQPFVADAIIANPPCFAHIHCAEALGIPLLLSFTMPWSPTVAFPHPLVNITQSNAEMGLTNYMTYAMAELMTWQGLGDIINNFRENTLGLEALSARRGPGLLDRLRVPWTYCFSPEIVPKPADWSNHIDVVGFYFLDLAANYAPPADLLSFLDAGPPPVYIGFGSVVVDNPDQLTETIFEATRLAGVRALVSPGWGKIGSSQIPEHVFILPNVPHDWLFTRVAAVCHHGGAGTTAIGLRLGKPTIIVPFFGDQPFWGAMVHKAGAGPEPIKKDKLTVEKLRAAIEFCLTPGAQDAAEIMGASIRQSGGVAAGVQSFYRHLPLLNMRCDLCPERNAVWWSTKHCLKLSAFAAQALADAKLIDLGELDLHRSKEYDSLRGSPDPLSGGVMEIFTTILEANAGIAKIFNTPIKGMVNTTVPIPHGVVMILATIGDGVYSAPKLYGSKVRQTGKIEGFKTGLKEGVKGLYYGYHDGITGLVTEPYEGAKKGGFAGLVKGALRSYANATVRPMGGIIGVVAKPLRGALLSLSQLATGPTNIEPHLRFHRIAQGKDAIAGALDSELDDVIQAFHNACLPHEEKARKDALGKMIKTALEQRSQPTTTPPDTTTGESASISPPLPPRASSSSTRSEESTYPPTGSDAGINWSYGAEWEQAVANATAPPPPAYASSSREARDEDEQFAMDMERAKILSMMHHSR